MKIVHSLIASLPFLLGSLALSQQVDPCATAPQSCATLINTRASSRLRLPNSAADISVAITATDKDLPTVQQELAAKSATLMTYLRAQQAQRLITNEVSFEPQTKTEKNGPDKTVGYTGTLGISFRTTAEKASQVLAGVLSNGANHIDSTVFTPTEEDVATARRELAATATKSAMAQAEAVAKAGNMHVVAVRQINVEGDININQRAMPMFARSAMKVDAAPAPIQTAAGEQEVSLSVNVVAAAVR